MGLVSREKEGVACEHMNGVEEEDAETADVSRVQLVQRTDQILIVTPRCVERAHVLCDVVRYAHVIMESFPDSLFRAHF